MGTVLVTGGAGFIGSHVCKALAASGSQLVVYDNLNRGNRLAVQWCELVEGDLSDKQLLRKTMEDNSVDSVIHFAALAYVRESMRRPDMYWQNNVIGTKILLDAMKETGVKRIVFSSSCASYGIPQNIPIRIDCSQNPINPYGRTKLACEWMIRDYAQQHGWDYAILRYFNVAGNDPDLNIGEVHEPETHIVPNLMLNALRPSREPVPIFGRSHPTADGTCVRDFIHVVDLASVHIRALEYIAAKGDSVVFNVGLGQGTSILELLKVCEEVTEKRIAYSMKSPNPGDPPCLIADPGGVWTTLGLDPRFTSIKTMVEHAWQWMQYKRPAWIKSKLEDTRSLHQTLPASGL
jgi:UDP-arabinose 4-epimerase